jgi:hypothetical protein
MTITITSEQLNSNNKKVIDDYKRKQGIHETAEIEEQLLKLCYKPTTNASTQLPTQMFTNKISSERLNLNIKQVKKDYIDDYKRQQGIPDTEEIEELFRIYHILLENVSPQPLK